jgi:hypothetical protein
MGGGDRRPRVEARSLPTRGPYSAEPPEAHCQTTCRARSETWCVRTARRDRGASDLGRSRCVLDEGVHAARMGPKNRRGRSSYKAESERLGRCAARSQSLHGSDEPR